MYSEIVTVLYKGSFFEVRVVCNPNTDKSVLKQRALKLLDDMFSKNGVKVV